MWASSPPQQSHFWWLSLCETGNALNALTQHIVSSRTTASMDNDSGHLCLEGKSPPECNGTSRGCFSGAKPSHEKEGGGCGLCITGSGTDPLQLAQCAVEGAETIASERLNTHWLSCTENTLIGKTHMCYFPCKYKRVISVKRYLLSWFKEVLL